MAIPISVARKTVELLLETPAGRAILSASERGMLEVAESGALKKITQATAQQISEQFPKGNIILDIPLTGNVFTHGAPELGKAAFGDVALTMRQSLIGNSYIAAGIFNGQKFKRLDLFSTFGKERMIVTKPFEDQTHNLSDLTKSIQQGDLSIARWRSAKEVNGIPSYHLANPQKLTPPYQPIERIPQFPLSGRVVRSYQVKAMPGDVKLFERTNEEGLEEILHNSGSHKPPRWDSIATGIPIPPPGYYAQTRVFTTQSFDVVGSIKTPASWRPINVQALLSTPSKSVKEIEDCLKTMKGRLVNVY